MRDRDAPPALRSTCLPEALSWGRPHSPAPPAQLTSPREHPKPSNAGSDACDTILSGLSAITVEGQPISAVQATCAARRCQLLAAREAGFPDKNEQPRVKHGSGATHEDGHH